MLRTIDRYKNDRGYILLMVVVMMLVMAVMAFGMNRRAGMQAKMAANQTLSSQTHLGQIAALEDAAWLLNRDPGWRTSGAGEDYDFSRHQVQALRTGRLRLQQCGHGYGNRSGGIEEA